MCLGAEGVLKRGFTAVAIAAVLFPSSATAGTATLMPGVTYTREVRLVGGSAVVLHVIRAPRDGGLHRLRPVLSNGTVLGVQSVPAMQRRVSRNATVAGVNGDFFRWDTGRPTSVFLRDGVLANRPLAQRSSLGIAFDGRLVVERLRFLGSWSVPGYEKHRLEDFNRPLLDPPGVALFTPKWGGPTPRSRAVKEVVLSGFPRVLPNGYLTGTVVDTRRGGGTTVPPGGAVLQARGFWRDVLVREARPGRSVTVRVRLRNLPLDVADAIGGGPVLVRDGQPVFRASEAFTTSHLTTRHPRTAVGQLAGGRVILVVADGRSSVSAGLTMWQLAQEMARLGAVTAMSLDGGGSSTMAFNGRVLNRPSDGWPRSVANGLFVFYYGVYAPPPGYRSFSPNGDGVADVEPLAAKVVRRSDVVLRLVRPDGAVRWRSRAAQFRGTFRKTFSRPKGMEGTWRWIVSATDAVGRASAMERRFVLNNTLGFLELSTRRMRVQQLRGGRLVISFRLANPARLAVTVRRRGRLVRALYAHPELSPGNYAVVWDGRRSNGSVVRAGTYTVRVRAGNYLGETKLEHRVRVWRAPLLRRSAR